MISRPEQLLVLFIGLILVVVVLVGAVYLLVSLVSRSEALP